MSSKLNVQDAVVSELKRLNEDVLESQNNGEKNNLRDSESFKKHYAAVLLQINEINDQAMTMLQMFSDIFLVHFLVNAPGIRS